MVVSLFGETDCLANEIVEPFRLGRTTIDRSGCNDFSVWRAVLWIEHKVNSKRKLLAADSSSTLDVEVSCDAIPMKTIFE